MMSRVSDNYDWKLRPKMAGCQSIIGEDEKVWEFETKDKFRISQFRFRNETI